MACGITCEMNQLCDRMKFVFSPGVILCGRLGSKHQLTNFISRLWSRLTEFYLTFVVQANKRHDAWARWRAASCSRGVAAKP